jgi:hypothetical protein
MTGLSTTVNKRFSNMVADGSKIDNLQIQAMVRAGQATLNFSCYLQQNNFNQQQLWADTATIYHIAKP